MVLHLMETTSIQLSMDTARNHWIVFVNPIASSHGLVFFFFDSLIPNLLQMR